MKFRHKRILARFRSEYRLFISVLNNNSPESNIYKAMLICAAFYFLFLFFGARPAEAVTDQAGALLLNR